MMARMYLGLGSNLGNKERNILHALKCIEERIGMVVSRSAFLISEPWGYQSGNTYLNACALVETSMKPVDCLVILKEIEKDMGRLKRGSDVYEDRIIDVDILFYDHLILETSDLVIPHPLLHQRMFVLKPLAEIAPELIHPVLNKTIEDLKLLLNEQS
jgi:2-amino-4-hydroxy-6-hydroxymethyldihydropteridine diphosphokinase